MVKRVLVFDGCVYCPGFQPIKENMKIIGGICLPEGIDLSKITDFSHQLPDDCPIAVEAEIKSINIIGNE